MKRSRKNSDEDKSMRKKKSKSNKRRRGDSSSSSSGSENDPRSQRRQQRRKKVSTKPEKRVKESKKSVQKKSRRSSRRRDSASPSSGRSCSTCGGSSSGSSAEGRRRQRRSRSPVARLERKWKSKSRARSGSRGRSRRRMSGPQEGSRLRSPSRSSSTCPSRSASSSSRGRSPVQSRRTREREIEKPKRFLSEGVVLRNNSDNAAERDKIIQAGGNSASSQSKNDAYEVQRNLDTHFRTSEVKNSVNVVRKDDQAKEGDCKLVPEKADNRLSKKANAGDDDFTIKNENPSSSVNSVADLELILRQKALENFRKFRSGASTNRASIGGGVANKVSETKDVPSEVDEMRQKALENHRKSQRGLAANIRIDADMENEATETHVVPPEITDMRQKALENFRKSRGGSLNSRLAANGEKGSDQTLSYYKLSDLVEVQNSGGAVRHRLTINEQQTIFHGDDIQSGRRMRSIVTIPETSTMKQNINSQNPSDISQAVNMSLPDNSNKIQIIDRQVEIDKSSTEAPSMKTSLEENKQHKRTDTEPASHAKDNIAEVDTQLISEVSASESKSRDGNNVENSGSQFQEKKFSRMHDGELVQVSYKVYIPTRSPSFARRKLQR